MILERRIVIQLLLNYLVGHPWHDAQQQPPSATSLCANPL